ncbi:MAG: hypothetical protein KDK91_24625, partial [Gammaproteobacteria bacterium]|nr:hypothetical protein [Gammaproteobacteria bacterium]
MSTRTSLNPSARDELVATALAMLLTICSVLLGLAYSPAGSAQTRSTTAEEGPATAIGGNSEAASRPQEGLSLEQIDARIKELEGGLNPEDSVQTQTLELYRTVRSRVEAKLDHDRAANEYRRIIQNGPEELASLEKTLAASPAPIPTLDPQTPANVVEQRLIETRSALAAARSTVAEADKTLAELKDRPSRAAAEASEARAAITRIDNEDGAQPADAPAALKAARALALTARKEARLAQLARIEQELLSLDIRTRLVQARRTLAAREVTRLDEQAKALETQLTAQRASEAQSALKRAEAAQREAAGKHPLLAAVAGENARLSQTLADQLQRLEGFRQQLLRIKSEAEDIGRSFKTARQRVELSRLSDTLGQVLREQRNRLPDVRRYRVNAEQRSELLGSINLAQLEVDEQRQALVDLEAAVGRVLREAGLADSESMRQEVRTLLTEREPVLGQLSRAYSDQSRLLTEMDVEQRQLVAVAVEYGAFLDRHLIWTPSVRPFGMQVVYEQPAAWAYLLTPTVWIEVLGDLLRQVRIHMVSSLLTVVLIVYLFWSNRRTGAHLRALTERMRRIRDDSFGHTLNALFITILIPMPWFLLLGGAGLLLDSAIHAGEFSRAVGAGLINGALLCFGAMLLRGVMRSSGLGEAHFNWNPDSMRRSRRTIDWWILVSVPAMVLATAFDLQSNTAYRESIGRSLFVISTLALSYLAWRLLHPRYGLPASLLSAHPDGWLSRLRPVWYPAAILVPVSLAVLAALGYVYTARQLELRLVTTVAMFAGLIVLRYMVFRWLQVTRRKHALQKARERWEARRQQQNEPESDAAVVEEPQIDIEEVGEQTRHLINTALNIAMLIGLWLVWSAVIPALGVLNEVELWRHTTSVDGQMDSVPVTLQGLLVMLFVIFMTTAAARNLPGVLEIAVLQRLPLDFGSRYAISTVMQYIIAAIGILYAFSTVGVAWADVQWLVAALSVGLGFGL